MANGFVHLDVRKDVKQLVIENCKTEFLVHHPEMQGRTITHNHIVKQLAIFYLDPRGKNRDAFLK